MYNNDAPPGYIPPPGATKMNPNQNGNAMEMPQYGFAPQQTGGYPMGQQQTGVMGGSGDPEAQQQTPQQLPPRPQQAKMAITNFVSRFRR